MHPQYNEYTYQTAVKTVAQMIAAMLAEDGVPGDDADSQAEYVGFALEEIQQALAETLNLFNY